MSKKYRLKQFISQITSRPKEKLLENHPVNNGGSGTVDKDTTFLLFCINF